MEKAVHDFITTPIGIEKDFEAFINAIPQLAWMTTPEGEVYWCNDRFYQYTGMTPEIIKTGGWVQVHNPSLLPEIMESWLAAVAAGSAWERLMPLKGRDHRFKWFLVRTLPVRNENGTIVRWVGTSTDINEQVKFQRQLSDTLETMSDTFLAIDGDWVITQVNSVLIRETGLSRKDIVGRDFRDVFLSSPEAKKSKYWTEYHRLMEERVPVTFEEYYAPLDMWTATRAYPTSEGGFTIFSVDITKKKKLEEQMKTPIAEIQRIARRVQDPLTTENERAELLKLVESSEVLSGIIHTLGT